MASDVIEVALDDLRRHGVVRARGSWAEVLVVLVDNEIKAYNGICPHLGGPLLEGEIRGDRLSCPWHRYEWSLRTGKCLTIPGEAWDGVEGYERPTTPYSRGLSAVKFELSETSVRFEFRRPTTAGTPAAEADSHRRQGG